MPRRHELTDAEWARLAPLLPPRHGGKPRQDDRRILNPLPWKLAPGAPGRALPERYGPWQTVSLRFWRWTRARSWDQLFAAVQRQVDASGQVEWEVHFVASTVIWAPQHAAGAKGRTPKPRRSAEARAATRRRSTSAPKAAASR